MSSDVPPEILARGPWALDQVRAVWSDEPYDAPAERVAAADAAIEQLRARSSPSHDGWSARLVSHSAENGTLELRFQPTRWSLRLVAEHAS